VRHNDKLLQRVQLTNILPEVSPVTPTSILFFNVYVTNGSALLGCKSLQPWLEHTLPETEDLQPEEEQVRLSSYLATRSSHPDGSPDTTMNLNAAYVDLTLFAATHGEGKVP
jgi:hypothetical protein